MAGYNLITDDSEALQAYLNNITHSTPLSLEEEKECADTGDWEKLVNANLEYAEAEHLSKPVLVEETIPEMIIIDKK